MSAMLTPEEVAKAAGVSKQTVHAAIREGRLPAARLSRKTIRLRPADVEKWLTPAPTAPTR